MKKSQQLAIKIAIGPIGGTVKEKTTMQCSSSIKRKDTVG